MLWNYCNYLKPYSMKLGHLTFTRKRDKVWVMTDYIPLEVNNRRLVLDKLTVLEAEELMKFLADFLAQAK